LCNSDGYDREGQLTQSQADLFRASWAPMATRWPALAAKKLNGKAREKEFKTPAAGRV